jgi:glycosyltransferase involved in cell wall biosynthesis
VQARAHDIHRDKYLFGFEEKFGKADFVITNTRYNFEYLHSRMNGSLNGKANLVYNGLNLEKFIPNHQNNGKQQIIRLLCVARLIEQKGLVCLLNACKELKDKGCKFICEIIGGPESLYMNYYVSLKKLHKKLELQENVFFLDAKPFDEVLEHFNHADIFVLPCIIAEDGSRDITPNSLIEAMAMKLPVISTSVTGIPEIVDNGINGILIPPNNIEALVQAIEKLIGDPLLRKQLGDNARKKIEERFDIKKNINEYVNLFGKQMRN